MPRMIFVYTGKFSENPNAGSAVRPVRMLEAFKEIGYEVSEVSGYSTDRARTYAAIRRKIREGIIYDFCYIETTTMPMALGDPGHLPLRPFLDLRFFSFLRNRNIPVLFFYRDAHWRFPGYAASLSNWRRRIALAFYRWEFKNLARIVNRVLLPSREMDRFLPDVPRFVDVLPPGCDLNILVPSEKHSSDLEILYVGGVSHPYDLSELFDSIRGSMELRLTIVCREAEAWEIQKECEDKDNIRIIHRNSEQLKDEYNRSDIASLYLAPGRYFFFTMPVKLFEAIGYGVPVLARSGTATGDFVSQENVGWVADGPETARVILKRLSANPKEVSEMRLRVREAATRHTWAERARKVSHISHEIRSTYPDNWISKSGKKKDCYP